MQKRALITPTYYRDFERFKLLADSIDEYIEDDFTHYVVVENRDLPLFTPFQTNRRLIVPVESIVPPWLFRIPFAKRWWMSLKTPPVRNWLMQQLVKLSIPAIIPENTLVYVDSDSCFIRPVKLARFEKDGLLRLYRIPGEGNIASHYPWHQTASALLGLQKSSYWGARYISQMITWRKDQVLKMHEHIQNQTQESWQNAICSRWHLSEYVLYGVFCDQVLKGESGHYHDPTQYCLEYWKDVPLSKQDEEQFLSRLNDNHLLVMLSSKANMPIERHREIIGKLKDKVLI